MAKHSSVHPNTSINVRRDIGMAHHSPDLDTIAEKLEGPGTVEAARMAVKLAEVTGHVPAIVESLKRAGIVLRQHRDWEHAAKFIEQAISLIDHGHPSSELADLLLLRSRFRIGGFGLRELRTVAAVAQESSLIAEAVNDRPLLAEALCLAAEAQTFIGDTELAWHNLQRALIIAEESGNKHIAGHAFHTIGNVLLRRHQYDQALKYFLLNYELMRGSCESLYLGIMLEGIATCLMMSGEYRSADPYFQQAVTILDEVGSYCNRDTAIIGHAINYIKRGEVEAGLEMTYPVIGRMRMQTGEYCLCFAYSAAAMGTLALNDLRRAHDYANRMLKLAMSISDMGQVIAAHRLLASIAEQSASSFWSMHVRGHSRDTLTPLPGLVAAESSEYVPHMQEPTTAVTTNGHDDVTSYKVALKRQSRELLMSGLQLSRNNEMILQLRHKIEPFLERDDDAGRLAVDLIDVLGPADGEGDQQGSLGRQFHDLSSPFLKRLSVRYPELTVTELKVCTLLRSNLSSKEIARMLSLSPHTVDTHRLQIRRKLGLSRRENLHTHLVSFD